MFNLSTGSNNTAVGRNALYNITTGGSNIGIGLSSGFLVVAGTANQTSSNSIYLGNNTRSYDVGNTNEIVIGDSTYGNGSNSVTLGNTSITKTILNGS